MIDRGNISYKADELYQVSNFQDSHSLNCVQLEGLRIYSYLEPKDYLGEVSLSIGVYDGFHKGHQALIAACCSYAKKQGLTSVAMTFSPNPGELFMAKADDSRLMTDELRVKALLSAGIDYVMLVDFTKDFSHISYDSFVREWLKQYLKLKALHVGAEFKTGYKGQGTVERLGELASELDFELFAHAHTMADSEVKISSSSIRKLLQVGELKAALELLGHAPLYAGKVIKGRQLGRQLGYPTANVLIEPELCLPKRGVYACFVPYEGKLYQAATHVGEIPMFEGTPKRVCEVHLLDFDGDLYDQELDIYFVHKLRDSEKFESLERLQEEIKLDSNWVKEHIIVD